MKIFLFILFYLGFVSQSFSQSHIWGKYVNSDWSYRSIDFKPDHSFISYNGRICLQPASQDSGSFTVEGDTIFLSYNNSEKTKEKFLYIFNSRFDDDLLCQFKVGAIYPVMQRDSILPDRFCGRLSDYDVLVFSGYTKQKGYYDNGKAEFSRERLEKSLLISYYYESGQLKNIEQYRKGRKSGEWFYYNELGDLNRIERYKRGKLRKTLN